jgi:predicted dienelactone hydrolase
MKKMLINNRIQNNLTNIMKCLASILIIFSLTACDGDGGSSATSVSFDDEPGPFSVGQRTDVMIYDEVRNRDVIATFWYPTDGENAGPEQTIDNAKLVSGNQNFPLVILVHGILDNAPGTWPYLAPHLASHGYVVIAPSTGSTFANAADIVNHPGDISFLIDMALGLNPDQLMFDQRIDAEKIAVGGFSFGGLATYLIAYDPQYIDSRIKAAIVMAGASGAQTRAVNPNVSLFSIYGTEDPVVSYDSGLNIYEAASMPKYFMTLDGGGHLGFTRSDENFDGATMDQGRQETLTRLAVFAYLTSLFAESDRDRAAAVQYLQSDFTEDNLDADIMFEVP